MSERENDKVITFGKIQGSTYMLLSVGVPPEISKISYGHLDKEIDKMIRRRKTCKVPRRVITRSLWTDWVTRIEKMPSDYSIKDYKAFFDGKIPVYALSFAKRRFDDTDVLIDRYKTQGLLPQGSRNRRFWRYERELLIPEKNRLPKKYVIVERVFGAYENGLNKVTLFNLFEPRGLLNIHEENNLGHGIWERTTREVDDRKFVGKTWPTFRDLPDMWSKYF